MLFIHRGNGSYSPAFQKTRNPAGKSVEKLERLFGSQRSAANSLEELDHAIDNDTTEEEKNILKGIIKFGNITVKQIMKTRLDVSGIEDDLNFGQLKQKIEELHYSRLPVYKKSLDEITGMIHTKDLIPI